MKKETNEKEEGAKVKAVDGFVAENISFPALGLVFTSTPEDPKCLHQLEEKLKEITNG